MSELRAIGVVVLLLLPGWTLAGLLPAARVDRGLRLALAPTAAAALVTLVALVLWFTGIDARGIDAGVIGLGILGLLGPIRERGRPRRPDRTEAALLALTAVLVLSGILAGASFRSSSDVPDHVGTLRAIQRTGEFFPADAFFADGAVDHAGIDARKGLLHPVYASLARLAGADPVAFWLAAPAVTAALAPLAAYALVVLAGWGRGAGLLAFLLVCLNWGGGLGGALVDISPYPNRVATGFLWTGIGCLLAAAGSGGRPAMIAAALALWAGVAAHPMIPVFAAVAFAVILPGAWLLRDRLPGGAARVFLAGVLLAVPALPYLLVRLATYAPANPIHTELQGMLLLGDDRFVADPLLLLSHVGWAGPVAGLLLLVVHRRAWRQDLRSFYVFWTAVFLVLVTLNPWLVPVLQKSVTYLVFRSFWLLPPALAAAVTLPRLARGGRLARAAAVVLALSFLPGLLRAAPERWLTPGPPERRDALAWRAPLEGIVAEVGPGATVLSDPITSYVLPAFTDLHVAVTLDQHGPPNDARAVERAVRARAVLSPAVPPAVAWKETRAAGADAVLLNLSFPGPVGTLYWEGSPGALARRAEQLRASWARPWFGELSSPAGFALFVPQAPDRVPPAPEVPDGTADPDLPVRVAGDGLGLVELGAPQAVAPGDTLFTRLVWTRTGEVDLRLLRASVRFDALEAPGRGAFLEKPLRKLAEKREGVRYRFRVDTVPGGAEAPPPDLWVTGRPVVQELAIPVPADLAPGVYRISVGIAPQPAMPNHRLRDFLKDDDLYAGTEVARVEITVPTP